MSIFSMRNKHIYVSDVLISLLLTLLLRLAVNQETLHTSISNSLSKELVAVILTWIIVLAILVITDMLLLRLSRDTKFSGTSHQSVLDKMLNKEFKYLFLYVAILFFLLWLPYLIWTYPGSAWYDCSSSIKQFYGAADGFSNWNPIIQTLIIGGVIKLGDVLVNENFGVFLYLVVQMILASTVISYVLVSFYKLTDRKSIFLLGVFCYGVLPVYPIYITAVGKDTNWSLFILLLLFMTLRLKNDPGWLTVGRHKFLYVLAFIAVSLLRNTGVYIAIAFSLVAVMFIYRKNRIRFGTLIVGLTVAYTVWINAFLPFVGVSTANMSRDSWNVQLQQMARYINKYPEEISEHDKEIISKMTSYEDMASKYNPDIVDPVTNTYYGGDTMSKEEKTAFLDLYWRMFRKHPYVYIDALVAKSCGYFTPLRYHSVKPFAIVGVCDVNASVQVFIPDFNLYNIYNIDYYSTYLSILQRIPIVSLFTHCGMWVWLIFFSLAYAIKRSRHTVLAFAPAFIIILGLLIVPVNNYFRYVLTLVFVAPFYIMSIYGDNKIGIST